MHLDMGCNTGCKIIQFLETKEENFYTIELCGSQEIIQLRLPITNNKLISHKDIISNLGGLTNRYKQLAKCAIFAALDSIDSKKIYIKNNREVSQSIEYYIKIIYSLWFSKPMVHTRHHLINPVIDVREDIQNHINNIDKQNQDIIAKFIGILGRIEKKLNSLCTISFPRVDDNGNLCYSSLQWKNMLLGKVSDQRYALRDCSISCKAYLQLIWELDLLLTSIFKYRVEGISLRTLKQIQIEYSNDYYNLENIKIKLKPKNPIIKYDIDDNYWLVKYILYGLL